MNDNAFTSILGCVVAIRDLPSYMRGPEASLDGGKMLTLTVDDGRHVEVVLSQSDMGELRALLRAAEA